MGYIENNLLKDEEVVFKTQHHWIIFIWPALFCAAGILVFNSGVSGGAASAVFGSVLILASAGLSIGQFISMKTNEFAVTNKRIIIKVGMMRRTMIEMDREKIEDVGVVQSRLGRTLNYGTLVIKGGGAVVKPFRAVANPMQFMKTIQEK